MTSSDNSLLVMGGISKSFGGVQALRDVDFSLAAGDIHGLVGENGAGKSTMMKIISGVHSVYTGTMLLAGKEVRFRSARDAIDAGIAMVHQELSTVADLTVAENVYLGKQPLSRLGMVDWRKMRRGAREQLARLGINIDPRTRIGDLPIGQQQLIELARVLFSGARIVILDEPTSALSPPEVEQLFSILKRLKGEGLSIIFISHFLDDILRVSDTITIFRNGRNITTHSTQGIDKGWVIERMIGVGHQELEESYLGEIALDSQPQAPVLLEARDISSGRDFRNISFAVHAGEVLGVYGFMGGGHLELARTLFGRNRPDHGSLAMSGKPIRFRNTAAARRAGIAFVPESRRAMLFYHEPLYKNASISILERISRFLLKPRTERRITRVQIEALRIKPPDVNALLGMLSGGNQQKVALAKWLTYPPKVLVLSEPTRGMDVGAKDDVVKIVRSLREQGIGVVVVSTEPETVLSLADRILVMKKGEIVREFAGETVSKDRLLEVA